MTGNWGGGYVTDIDYDHGYYREQSPPQLELATLLCGVAWGVPREGAHYLELGCGQGLGVLVTAATNPSWRVTGIDFNPAHVAGARELAREAGIENATFIEADLSSFAESAEAAALPEAHLVTLHGVWSWVAGAVRQGITRLIRARLAAGGVAHVSYNALPGWQGMLGMQRLLRESGLRLAQRSDRQAQAGLGAVRDLMAAEASMLSADQRIGKWFQQLGALSPTYLAHEFMNAAWQPCWHAEVAEALAEARLEWVGSAVLTENFPELTMTGPQRAVYERFEDPLMRELVKDLCLARTLRHDVYVRGPRRLTSAARDAALRELTIALSVPLARVALEVQVAAGKAELAPEFYRPVTEMLARGPAKVGALLHAPGAVASRENPAELAGLLVGTRQAVVVGRPGAAPNEAAMRLNAALIRRYAVTENLNRSAVLASPMLGAGLSCATPDLFVAGRALAGEEGGDPAGWVDTLGAGLDDENRERVREALVRARDETLPLLRQLGCLPR
jgi:SAM-dependent methyltransferase